MCVRSLSYVSMIAPSKYVHLSLKPVVTQCSEGILEPEPLPSKHQRHYEHISMPTLAFSLCVKTCGCSLFLLVSFFLFFLKLAFKD